MRMIARIAAVVGVCGVGEALPVAAQSESREPTEERVEITDPHVGTFSIVGFDPETGEFIEYLLPEMGVNIRRVYVDDSTDPVTFWIGSNHGASIISLQVLGS